MCYKTLILYSACAFFSVTLSVFAQANQPQTKPMQVAAPQGAEDTRSRTMDMSESETKEEEKRKAGILQAPLMLLIQYQEALRNGKPSELKRFMNSSSLSEFHRFTFTQETMKLEAQTLRDCGKGESVVEGYRAVVRFKPELRMCAPYLMEFQEGSWRVDFLKMSELFVFNTKYEWRLNTKVENQYLFAFPEVVQETENATEKKQQSQQAP